MDCGILRIDVRLLSFNVTLVLDHLYGDGAEAVETAFIV